MNIDEIRKSKDITVNVLYDNPEALFELQKDFIPQSVLKRIVSTERGLNAFIKSWTNYLVHLSNNPQWRFGGNQDKEDIAQNIIMGYCQIKETSQSQGGILTGIDLYDPTRKNTRETCCPDCKSSYWSSKAGNGLAMFKDWNIPEFRENLEDCRPSVKLRREKVCSKILSGPYEDQSTAAMFANGHETYEIDKKWYVICGHVIKLMSFQNYIHQFVMRPLKAEHRRYLTAKTKGRSNTIQAFICPNCNTQNEYDEEQLEENTNEDGTIDVRIACQKCNSLYSPEDLTIFTKERTNISLDAPLTEGEKGKFGDVLPAAAFVSEELQSVELQLIEKHRQVKEALNDIMAKRVAELESRMKDREITKIPKLERALSKAESKRDTVKVAEHRGKLENERANLIRDQNKIDYTKNLVRMYELHYIGDETGKTYDLRQLTEMFMFKSLPYTLCNCCGEKMFEQNERGKIENDYVSSRIALKKLAETQEIPGLDNEYIRKTPAGELYPHCGKYFVCEKCKSADIMYYAAGMTNPREPRIEITPHIFQPAQRELKELQESIWSFKLVCSNCATENIVRPDKETGKVQGEDGVAIKVSKTIRLNEDGVREAVRTAVQHTCSRCNQTLYLEDMVRSSSEKSAYEIFLQIKELTEERERLKLRSETRE